MPPHTETLGDRLKAQIAASGPMTIAEYMTACLHDPAGGYYATRPALGASGDFITAPLVSQMFGELIGLWAVETWRAMGSPAPFVLVEAGPGDGTLMSDLTRAARLDPAFLQAARLWLIETSAPLRAAQSQRLLGGPIAPKWASDLHEIPPGPMILIANELLDCLAPRQFVRTVDGWAERRVGLTPAGDLAFGLSPAQTNLPDAPQGAVYEDCAAQAGFAGIVAARIAGQGGAALLVDYGRSESGFGDTLQALRRHRKVDPLDSPGTSDLTVHADFPAVLAAARAEGAQASLLTQRAFLTDLGIGQRAAALAQARPDQAEKITRQFERLVDPDQMGELFKAACLYSAGLSPPAFEVP
jgi:NADH dehydrogenase [ubiquinone] 1 alpha subcomplex assembly factor 7